MKRDWLEWTILGVSVVLVVGLVGYLVVAGLTNDGPPAFRTEIQAADASASTDGGWLVPLRVMNDGGEAAVAVVIEGTATVAGVNESSQLVVDVVAAGSAVDLVLGFSARPDGEIHVRIVGFETP